MALDTHSPASGDNGPSLRSIQEELGISRYDIRPHITQLIDDPESEIDAPQKARIATLEALLIDEIWENIRIWISDNIEVQGLAETNLPVIIPGAYSPESEARLPRHSRDLAIDAVSEHVYRSNAGHSCQSYTRDVMQFFLLQWELKMKERLGEKGAAELPDEIWYERYIDEAISSRPIFGQFQNPATTKMYFGFGFGQSMFWRLPDSAHESVLPKLGRVHLAVIESVESALGGYRVDNSSLRETTNGKSLLSLSLLESVASQIDDMKRVLERGQEEGSVNFDSIATGCPAVYTKAFVETGQWIRNIRADHKRILSTP